jgi:hypothetical protein
LDEVLKQGKTQILLISKNQFNCKETRKYLSKKYKLIVIEDILAKIYKDKQLELEINKSYAALVKNVGDAEMSKTPLGIFRPGIFKLFKKLASLKTKGKIQGIIMYTNNGALPLVEFVNDVFKYVIKTPIFDGIFYFHHALRSKDTFGKPIPTKNWIELKRLLIAIDAPEQIEPKDVMFFDDQIHPPLNAALGENYIKVTSYHYNPPLSTVIDIYYSALKDSNILSDLNKDDFFNHVKTCTNDVTAPDVDSHLKLLTIKPLDSFTPKGKGAIPANNVLSSNHMMMSIINKLNTQSKKYRKRTLRQIQNNVSRKSTKRNGVWELY